LEVVGGVNVVKYKRRELSIRSSPEGNFIALEKTTYVSGKNYEVVFSFAFLMKHWKSDTFYFL
jgi:hypothetical protein